MTPPGMVSGVLALTLSVIWAPASLGQPAALRLAVVAPDTDHPAWASARYFSDLAGQRGLNLKLEQAPLESDPAASPEFYLMPVRSLAARVPALEVLELPFFFDDLQAIHQALDGHLGVLLSDEARRAGWDVLAFWDEGLHVMSGLRRYDRALNLSGMEFILLRPDPVAMRQFPAWHASVRSIRPQSLDELAAECVVGSRAGTLQELWREQVDRVHLTLNLTRHRYEGWLLLARKERWERLSAEQRLQLAEAVDATTPWQRGEAERREEEAFARLRGKGMEVHEVDSEERQAFVQKLPPWTSLLSEAIDPSLKQSLIAAALAGARSGGVASGLPPPTHPAEGP